MITFVVFSSFTWHIYFSFTLSQAIDKAYKVWEVSYLHLLYGRRERWLEVFNAKFCQNFWNWEVIKKLLTLPWQRHNILSVCWRSDWSNLDTMPNDLNSLLDKHACNTKCVPWCLWLTEPESVYITQCHMTVAGCHMQRSWGQVISPRHLHWWPVLLLPGNLISPFCPPFLCAHAHTCFM